MSGKKKNGKQSPLETVLLATAIIGLIEKAFDLIMTIIKELT